MPRGESWLLKIAECITDGSPVDWETAEAWATADQKVVIRQLRVLFAVADFHRGKPRAVGDSTIVR
jgi:hypothetical protein